MSIFQCPKYILILYKYIDTLRGEKKLICMHENIFYQNVLQISSLRYLYICVWKHIGFLPDDFLSLFLPILNPILSLYITSIVYYQKAMGLYLSDPWCKIGEGYDFNNFAVRPNAFIMNAALILHFWVFIKLYKQKRRHELQDHTSNSSIAKRDLLVNLFLLGLILLGILLFGFKIQSQTIGGLQYKIAVIFADMVVAPLLFSFIIPLTFIFFNEGIKKFVEKKLRGLKSTLTCCKNEYELF